MSDIVISALITVGGMLMVVFCNLGFTVWRERRKRTEAFFNNFFPERLNAHKEVMRIVTEAGFHDLDPYEADIAAVKEQLEIAVKRLFEAVIPNRLFIDDDLAGAIFMLHNDALTALEKLEETISPEAQFVDAASVYQFHNDQIVEMLREKSGIDIINEEFNKVVRRRKKPLPKKKQSIQKDARNEARAEDKQGKPGISHG
jgi:hypothetical protein